MGTTNSHAWQDATVTGVRDIAERIRRIELRVEQPTKAAAGTHLDLRLPLPDGEDVRSYSIVDSSPDGHELAISVLLTRDSRGGSEYMHQLAEGDTLRCTVPLQNFPLRVGAQRYLLVAGGIGITALIGMASVLKRLGADYRFVYVGRSRARMAYLSELQEEHGDRLVTHVDDEGAELDVDALLDGVEPGTELYLCGPIRLMDAVRRGWSVRQLPITDLRFETFGNSGWFDPEEFTVTIPRLGVTTTVAPDQSMLEALEDAGVDMMFHCRKGECGLCAVQVLDVEGVPDHRDVFLSPAQQDPESTQLLTCCVSRVVGRDGRSASITVDVT